MPRESNLEFKVGFFVIVAFIAFCVFIFSVSGTAIFEKGETLSVIFKFANGLKKSAPVRIAGVDEGLVKDITLFLDKQDGVTKARVELWIKKGARIPTDSVVIINQLGLMGEKYVEIIPGLKINEFIQDGQMMIGKDPISQEQISEKVLAASQKLESVASGVNDIIHNEKNVASLSQALEHLNSITGNMNDILEQVKKGHGTVGKLLYDQVLYDDLEGMAADLKNNPWKLLYKPKDK
ncbi:MAG: MCE family protein [Candidatus Omnitrophica bacterium]|nr:MCE family protein [Candidatus Omnitrophota bacterium]